MDSTSPDAARVLPRGARWVVLAAAFAALLFDGVELGLMPVCSISITKNLLGEQFTSKLGGDWFAWLTASLMLGAAIGGMALGAAGDRLGRTRALAMSILFYSVFAGLGAFANTLWQMLALRFLVGLGVGGVWPNGISLVSECWPNVSRPVVAGVVGGALNLGILLLSQTARIWPVTPNSWRWLFGWAALPALLGLFMLLFVSESPRWAEARQVRSRSAPLGELLEPPLRRSLIVGILLGSIPMVGAWAASKWLIPWADQAGGALDPGYKAATQGYWAAGAVLGSFLGAQLAAAAGRRTSYFLISLGSALLTCGLFTLTAPLRPEFLPLVFAQGFVATLFFGWLPLYLPELFPARVRATGTGIAYNVGRFATAIGVCAAGTLVGWFQGDLAKVGAAAGLIYGAGMLVIWWAPDTSGRTME